MKRFDFNYILMFFTGVAATFVIYLFISIIFGENASTGGFQINLVGYGNNKRYISEHIDIPKKYVIKNNNPYDIKVNKDGNCDIIIHGVKKNDNTTK